MALDKVRVVWGQVTKGEGGIEKKANLYGCLLWILMEYTVVPLYSSVIG